MVVATALGAGRLGGVRPPRTTTRARPARPATAASTELSAEAEDGGLEVSFELQSTAPGETWDVVLEQGDTTLLEGQRQTDEDAELDLDAPADENGSDEFTATATPADGGEPCTATLDPLTHRTPTRGDTT